MSYVLSELKIVPKSECSEASGLARDLGLELQAYRYGKPLSENVFKSLTIHEEIVWRYHCPTIYSTPPLADGNKSLANYGFDSIPIEVMRHWKTIKDNYAFDSYEIWTTERSQRIDDPLLIGIIGAKHYLLARWGLESPGDLSLKEIAQAFYNGIWHDYAWRRGWCNNPFISQSGRDHQCKMYLRWNSRLFVAAEQILCQR